MQTWAIIFVCLLVAMGIYAYYRGYVNHFSVFGTTVGVVFGTSIWLIVIYALGGFK